MLSFDGIVRGLRSVGVPQERAEAEARRQLGIVLPSAEDVRNADLLEKEEQHEIRKLFGAFGFKTYNLSQVRKSKQTPGLPDLWTIHRELPIAFWWETKRQVGGSLSGPQEDFRDECLRCRAGYGTGDRFAAQEALIALGIAVRCGKLLEPAACLDSRLQGSLEPRILSAP